MRCQGTTASGLSLKYPLSQLAWPFQPHGSLHPQGHIRWGLGPNQSLAYPQPLFLSPARKQDLGPCCPETCRTSQGIWESPFSLRKASFPLAFSNHFVSQFLFSLSASWEPLYFLIGFRFPKQKLKSLCRLLLLPFLPPSSSWTLHCAPMGRRQEGERRNLDKKRHKLKAQNMNQLHIYPFKL